jgi:hypothetical protein
MDWEAKYMEKLDRELNELRQHLNIIEQKITDNLERSMLKVLAANRERHQEYLSLNQRLDAMGGKVDRAIQWTVKFSVGTFIAVTSLIVALAAKFL